ncbi:MAG TPA: type II secretion system F family protein [Bacteriovoracaceae bacterium]|nr:type II secretion system F family protein [Bacteriovoracaceae bacterium]
MKLIFYAILQLLLMSEAQAQGNVCPKDFSHINSSCIQQSRMNYSEKPLILSNDLKGNIYFYQTPGGSVGKLKVIGTIVNNRECTLFLEAVTFDSRNFVPNSSLTIAVDRNQWLKNRIFLDREGLSALELVRKDNKCVLSLTKDASLAYFTKEVEKARAAHNLLFYSPLALVFIAIFIIVRTFMEDQDKFKASEALEEVEVDKNKKVDFLVKVTKPFYKRYFLPMVQGSKSKAKIRAKYRQKLANAGLTKDLTPEEFVSLKLFMILGGPFVFLAVRAFLEEDWPLSLTPIMGVVGFFYPNIWLNGKIQRRNQETLRAMPFIVDMLALSVEAGLDFMAAIQRVIEKAPPSPLVEEFETLIRETKIGSSRAEGLRQLSWRVNMIEINSFCATLIAADSVGASIGPILKQLSNELRVKRSSRAEQLGATAATKILIPMIFFILPAVLVAIFAPMVLKMMTGKL